MIGNKLKFSLRECLCPITPPSSCGVFFCFSLFVHRCDCHSSTLKFTSCLTSRVTSAPRTSPSLPPHFILSIFHPAMPPPQPPAALILPPGRLSLTALQFVAFILVRFAHCELSTGRLLRESSFSFLLFVAVTLM